MVELKEQYPYVDDEGHERPEFIKHYAEDEKTKEGFYIIQNETGVEYVEAVDLFPSRYTYSATEKKIEYIEEN